MWWRREKKEVSEFLYMILVSDARKGYAREVAQRMEVPYPTLSKYWLGKRRFPATLVKPLFAATGEDERVARFFLLGGSNYRLERETPHKAEENWSRGLLHLSQLQGKVAALYLEVSGTMQPQEAEQLDTTLKELVTQAESLRAACQQG